MYNLKTWVMENIISKVFMVVKPKITDLDTRLYNIETYITNLGGDFVGSYTEISAFPSLDNNGDSIKKNDWSILSIDDNGNEAGIYFFSGVDWVFGIEIPDMVDIRASLLATDAEVDAGTATDKVASVKQLLEKYARINGNELERFIAKDIVAGGAVNKTIIEENAVHLYSKYGAVDQRELLLNKYDTEDFGELTMRDANEVIEFKMKFGKDHPLAIKLGDNNWVEVIAKDSNGKVVLQNNGKLDLLYLSSTGSIVDKNDNVVSLLVSDDEVSSDVDNT